MVIQNGSLRLFRIFGISVFLHWSWALIAIIELQVRTNTYTTQVWNIAEYLSLFAIVLIHEFGHALACRSVGGTADRIMLWPLGGVAYVNPPPRAGALLWSIAAGPLVNVVLTPITMGAYFVYGILESGASPNLHHYLFSLAAMNVGLLIFNLLPVYPLDGGQILRAILWFFVGRIRSLTIASTIGLIGGGIGIAFAAWIGEMWFVILAGFAALQSWNGLKMARAMSMVLALPRYAGVRCPVCHEPPPIGTFWRCPCGAVFDAFEHQMVCPHCQRMVDRLNCPYCGELSPPAPWYATQREGQTFIWSQAPDSNSPNPPPA
ncbi:MAG TPA: site-2 protease family protein [Phycisphaerae bacterium]|nr:site-2 protease family protein [Phycisphaerae bacterium]